MYDIRFTDNTLICKDIPTKILAIKLAKAIGGDTWILNNGGICLELHQDERDKELLIDFILQGYSIEIGPLSLATINRRNGRKFQVDCDVAKLSISELYDDIEEAVKKFLESKKILRL